MYGDTLDFQYQHQQLYYKIPDLKINFYSKFAVKLFPTVVANDDVGSLKSLHTFLQICLYQMLVEFEQNREVQTTRNFDFFETQKKQNKTKKRGF